MSNPQDTHSDAQAGSKPNMPAPVIDGEGSYAQIHAILNAKTRPPRVLRALMNAFERYRQARKIGWSRPWNKYGLMTFASLSLKPAMDDALITAGLRCIENVCEAQASTDAHALTWVRELIDDPSLMGFVFLSELQETHDRYESLTFSLGRVAPGNRRHRDRVDIVFDARVVGERADELTRVRVFVDPWRGPEPSARTPLIAVDLEAQPHAPLPPVVQEMCHRLCQQCAVWLCEPSRSWDHWTSAYIDYFGPRNFDLDSGLLTDLVRRAADRSRPQAA